MTGVQTCALPIYNGVDNKFRIALSPLEKGKLKEIIIPYFSKNPGIVFITVANLVPYKDYFTVLRALRLFKKTHDFYYLIVGGGPLKKEIESLIKDYMLENQIVMIDGTENVRDYLLISDLMIHSSRGEGISNAILEGMYSGLPVIATNVGGIPETVYPDSSLLFPYKDHVALYSCLLRAPELIAKFDPSTEEYQTHLKKFSDRKSVV